MDIVLQISCKKCERCGHEWLPKVKSPLNCPHCHSPYWGTPRKSVSYIKKNTKKNKVKTTFKE
jgi:predicted Zn-ribbon and HTH transcriptional regulator